MKKLTLLIIALYSCLFTLNSKAQNSTLKAANKAFFKKTYTEAIPKYEYLLKKDSTNSIVLTNLGECYRLTNNNKGQLICYRKLIELGKAEETQKLYYGQALMEAGEYEEAKQYMNDVKNDKRGETFLKDLENLQQFYKNTDAYKLDTVSFNSNYDDFCAIPFEENKIVYTSTKTHSSWITRRHGWTGNNYCQMYITTKESNGEYKKPAVFLKEVSTKFNDGPFCATKDGKTVFFNRNTVKRKDKSLDQAQKLKIFQATLVNGKVDALLDLKFNSKEYNCAHPAISDDGNTLYFSSDMGGGQGGMDIWYCTKDSGGVWSTPINLGETINTKGNELFPSITKDNVLYFSSNGRGGLGALDIYEVKIKNGKIGRVYNMGAPINSPHDDFAYNLSSDGKTGYLSSNRKTGGMNDDIYTVDVLKKVPRGRTVNFIVKDKTTQEVIPLANLKLNTDSFITNEKGEVKAIIEDDTNYLLFASKEQYINLKDSIASNSIPDENEYTKVIELDKTLNISFLAGIYDARTGIGIGDVKITMKDLTIDSTDFELARTENNGEYRKPIFGKKVGDKLAYLITIEKEGYVTKKLNFIYDIKKEGEIQLNELLALTIGKVEVGADLGKMIDIKPIYFDLGKSIIRKDAAIELDKVVDIMTKYPAIVVELGAHTDCRGNATANLKLSAERARASALYIIKQGISKNRISGKGYGESKLLNSCGCEGKKTSKCSEAEHQKNRRTEFIITKVKE